MLWREAVKGRQLVLVPTHTKAQLWALNLMYS
jgi:hypothetical protein